MDDADDRGGDGDGDGEDLRLSFLYPNSRSTASAAVMLWTPSSTTLAGC